MANCYKEPDAAEIGGGNTVVQEALYLSNVARKIYRVPRGDSLREKVMQYKLFARIQADKVESIWQYQVDEVLGNKAGVTGLRGKSVRNGSTREIAMHGLTVAVGRTPSTSLFEGRLQMRNDYLVIKVGARATPRRPRCRGGSLPGQVYRRTITSAGLGWMAALGTPRSSLSTALTGDCDLRCRALGFSRRAPRPQAARGRAHERQPGRHLQLLVDAFGPWE